MEVVDFTEIFLKSCDFFSQKFLEIYKKKYKLKYVIKYIKKSKCRGC